jgi:hypothetical protein
MNETTLPDDDSRFWRRVAVLFGIISILKGVRAPGLWAATQANLDYSQGFIKRGLFGQVMRSLGIQIAHYDVFAYVSGFLSLGLLVTLLWWVSRSAVWRLGNGVVVAVCAASFALTYWTQLSGYFEIPLGFLSLVAVSVSVLRRRSIAVLVCGGLGVLIHESYVLTFLPMTLLPAILAASSGNRAPVRELAPVAAVVAVIGAIAAICALGVPMTAQHAARLQAAMSTAADFPTRGDFFPVLTRSTADNVLVMLKTMSTGPWWLAQANAFITFMPTTAFFLWIAFDIVEHAAEPARRFHIKVLVAFTGLCPLLMQILGYDIYRWYALAAFSSFISMSIVCKHYGAPVLAARMSVLRNVAVVLIAINMATGTGLFDGNHVNTFPFVDLWKAVLDWFTRGGHFVRPAV